MSQVQAQALEAEQWFYEKKWNNFRRGTRTGKLRWDGGCATVRFYDQGAPKTVEAVLRALPITMPMIHVAWSGEMLVAAQSYGLKQPEFENEVRLVRPGDLGWDPKFGELTVTYGTAECKLPSGPNNLVIFASVVEGLDALAVWSRERRFRGVADLVLEI
ncbi:DUF3830 family protein [Ramlibacter humi]|uniref:DUF3830 family protein n=1 Tax=Ramlibacter humi TaxID=2530451 RepID=A0A4Z0BFM0_9BURK|nr:DUF3830 family protein [Ramlibacter humi]TFY97179.1 DUF3830 family protein [Ramlibacter humi]